MFNHTLFSADFSRMSVSSGDYEVLKGKNQVFVHEDFARSWHRPEGCFNKYPLTD